MKNKIVPQFVSSFVVLITFLLLQQSLKAQSAVQDSLAVRIILNENGLTTTPVASVVTKNSSNRIIELDLSNLKILKITSEIGVITELRSLILYNNAIDSLPVELWQLDQLTVLDLSNNKLGQLNPGIGRLESLLFLSARSNELKTLPAELFSLTHLENLIVSHNSLDTISDSLINFPFLKYLNLANNQLRAIPVSIAVMTQLDSLDLAGNQISLLPELITQLSSTAVSLSDNNLCDLSASLETWATSKDPTWKASQTCGIISQPGGIIREKNQSPNLYLIHNFKNEFAKGLISLPNLTMELRILDLKGKVVFKASLNKNNFEYTWATLTQELHSSNNQKLLLQILP